MSDDKQTSVPVADDAELVTGKRAPREWPTDGGGHSPRARVTGSPTASRRLAGMRMSALDMAEGGLLADVGIVLDLASIYLPIIGAILTPTVPTPFAILTLRRGPRVAFVASAVAMFLVTVLAGPHFGWRMGLEAALGILMGWAMRRRWRSLTIVVAGTVIVATATFVAALLVLVATGLPTHDVVRELRNVLHVLAGLAAFATSALGLRGQWLAVRPGLASFGNALLNVWPLLLYAYATAFALPAVIVYYAIANSAARVLGADARPFPPRWITRLILWGLRTALWSLSGVAAVVRAPFRVVGWLVSRAFRRRSGQPAQ
ncbi:MAG TPA: DUF2232 domain-containing protein [Ktedonobacterales bacterium]|nr:DUF2232 domain-containing protein [Ktedonobacterales bacterium]